MEREVHKTVFTAHHVLKKNVMTEPQRVVKRLLWLFVRFNFCPILTKSAFFMFENYYILFKYVFIYIPQTAVVPLKHFFFEKYVEKKI